MKLGSNRNPNAQDIAGYLHKHYETLAAFLPILNLLASVGVLSNTFKQVQLSNVDKLFAKCL